MVPRPLWACLWLLLLVGFNVQDGGAVNADPEQSVQALEGRQRGPNTEVSEHGAGLHQYEKSLEASVKVTAPVYALHGTERWCGRTRRRRRRQ